MKFNLNLGNLHIKQEKMDVVTWNGKNKHVHHTPERAFNLEGFNLGLEFEMDEIVQLCKSSDMTMLELMKLAKEAIPQIVEFKEKAKEKEIADLKNKIYSLEAEIECKKVRIKHVEERSNKLVKENNELKEKAKLNDRELY